jgi:hypothetical protein
MVQAWVRADDAYAPLRDAGACGAHGGPLGGAPRRGAAVDARRGPGAAKPRPAPTEQTTTPAHSPPAQAEADAAIARADTSTDASVDTLLLHSERLVETLAAHAGPLALAKIGDDDRAGLTAGVATLRAAEDAWTQARTADAPGTVAEARVALATGRRDLHGALRVFVKDPATQRLVDGVGEVEDDDDLAADVAALLPMARKHVADLAGTEITPAHVDGVEEQLARFRKARVGVRSAREGTTTAQALSKAALSALRARNEAFWALSALNRDVSGRARFRFRDDPKLRALFGAYSADRPGARRRAPVDEPKPGDEKPTA